jgi:putative CocE/NonD family hydrolase
MSKRTIAGLLGVIGAAGVAAYNLRRQIWQQVMHLPPVQNDVSKEANVRVAMLDGVALATDVYRPKTDGRYPTILIRTPYGRANPLSAFSMHRIAERGYNVVCQDCRGCGDSEGDFEPYVHEAEDGKATIEWIVQQPWSDTQVGMWGQSYVGYVQWAAATTGTPYLKAMVPSITMAHLGYDPEAGNKLSRSLNWLYILDAMQNKERSQWQNMARMFNRKLQDEVVARGTSHLPLSTADEAAFGYSIPLYRNWMEHAEAEDDYWDTVDHRPAVKDITIPTHHVAGWYDIFLDGQLADYAAMRDAGAAMRNAGQTPYLTIGSWTHMDFGAQWETLRQSLDWFDAQLKGQQERLRATPIRLYVMGADEWRDYAAWPPPATATPYYLHENGRLAPTPSLPDSPPDPYHYDPADPTPNIGGALLSTHAGAHDNRDLEARADVLTYTTAPLTEPPEIIGPIRLQLYVQSNREHTDFFGRLCDVQEDGGPNGLASLNICDGFFRIEPGKGSRQADGTLCIELNLSPTAYRFQPGHRLRLQVSSGAHPRIARNLGTGDNNPHATEMVTAEQTVFHDVERPSALILPITLPG